MHFNKELKQIICDLDTSSISDSRKVKLDILTSYIQEQIDKNEDVRLHFICTHNSRRSQLSQVWAQAMASYFEVQNVSCYSGGTEATAVPQAIISTLQNAGFKVIEMDEKKNRTYDIIFAEQQSPITIFSKKIDDAVNPTSKFIAIMTCSQADDECPYVTGAEQRLSLAYDDPKLYDGSDLMSAKYQERSTQIATEQYYTFSKITQQNAK